jgi:hypothetical protein
LGIGGEGKPNLEFFVPQAAGFAQGRRGPHDSRLVAYVYCDMPVAGWGLSGSICLVRWFEVSKRWRRMRLRRQDGCT